MPVTKAVSKSQRNLVGILLTRKSLRCNCSFVVIPVIVDASSFIYLSELLLNIC